jgi:hypothetical protein
VYGALAAGAGLAAGALDPPDAGAGADPGRVVGDDRGAPDELDSNIEGYWVPRFLSVKRARDVRATRKGILYDFKYH